MLAQKQPFIKRVRNSSLVECPCAEDLTGLNYIPKLGMQQCMVGERRMMGEVTAEAVVDVIRVRMPE